MTTNFNYGDQQPIETVEFADGLVPTTRSERFDEMVRRTTGPIAERTAASYCQPVAGDSAGSTGLVAGEERRPVTGSFAGGELGNMTEDAAGEALPASSGILPLNVAGLRMPGRPADAPITSGAPAAPATYNGGLGDSAYTSSETKVAHRE